MSFFSNPIQSVNFITFVFLLHTLDGHNLCRRAEAEQWLVVVVGKLQLQVDGNARERCRRRCAQVIVDELTRRHRAAASFEEVARIRLIGRQIVRYTEIAQKDVQRRPDRLGGTGRNEVTVHIDHTADRDDAGFYRAAYNAHILRDGCIVGTCQRSNA